MDSERSPLARRRALVAVLAVAVVTLVGAPLAIALTGDDDSTEPAAVPSLTSPAVPASPQATGSPAAAAGGSVRPNQVCAALRGAGVATAPAGAVVISPGQNLSTTVDAGEPGTTYWLAPGTHRFGTGEYDQVGPHQGDVFIGAPGAVIDGQNKNRYAFGGSAPDVTIRSLVIQNFGSPGDNPNEGVVNHDSGSNWNFADLTIQRNAGAGVMLGDGNTMRHSCLRDNGQYGFQGFAADGVTNMKLLDSEVTGNNTDDWEKRQEGCGCSGGGKFWDVRGGVVTGNYVHDNRGAGLWADSNNAGFLFRGNYIANNDGEGIMYELGYNAEISNNVFLRNGLVSGPNNPGFPTGAIYISEAGSDPRVPGPYGKSFRITGNSFVDNWSGVIGWENADRFSGSPANTSTGVTTLVNPGATVAACSDPAQVKQKPLFDDCRWKTQNLDVTGNTFVLNPENLKGCTPNNGCGLNGVFSQVGSSPDWSPYKDYVVPDNITFRQHNVWRDNTYRGPWSFVARVADNYLSLSQWQAAPYRQDPGSTSTG